MQQFNFSISWDFYLFIFFCSDVIIDQISTCNRSVAYKIILRTGLGKSGFQRKYSTNKINYKTRRPALMNQCHISDAMCKKTTSTYSMTEIWQCIAYCYWRYSNVNLGRRSV